MRVSRIDAENIPPIQHFKVSDLSNVVVLAGPNGVGKTRLIQAILQAFQGSGGYPNVRLTVEATTRAESFEWGGNTLDTSISGHMNGLRSTLQKNRRRGTWQSSVIQFESNRTIQQVQPFDFSLDITDPSKELLDWRFSFTPLTHRWHDTVHSLFRQVQSRRDDMARTAEKLIKQGTTTMNLDFPDPLLPYKNAFRQLLAPKELLDPEAKLQQLYYAYEDQQFPIDSLSSGEREVVNIVFDFLLRNPSDSVIIFDEPELHLHPELSYKLLQTLQGVGANNQFIYCTHSPDIITASLENSVVFLGPPKEPPTNQAIVIKEDDETHEALKLLGRSIGIIALGKKLVS